MKRVSEVIKFKKEGNIGGNSSSNEDLVKNVLYNSYQHIENVDIWG